MTLIDLLPRSSDFCRWQRNACDDCDLLFVTKKSLSALKSTKVLILNSEEVRTQGHFMWSLNRRSWYGYALHQADYCSWVPPGFVESLSSSTQHALAEEQIRLGVPTLFQKNLVPKGLQKKLISVDGFSWLTAGCWNVLSARERSAAVKAWFVQNEIQIQSSYSFQDLPLSVRNHLKKIQCHSLLNTFADCSGPNCFAAVAGAISDAFEYKIHKQWLHWPPFERFLKEHGFVLRRNTQPQTGDVLIFFNGRNAVHAAYYLGKGFYFEKAGQDFYEPYRVVEFSCWRKEWPQAALQIWSKRVK